jgi:hypothetical protein
MSVRKKPADVTRLCRRMGTGTGRSDDIHMFTEDGSWVHCFSISCFLFLERINLDLIGIVT